jgi:CheY-like chemotaxis protein
MVDANESVDAGVAIGAGRVPWTFPAIGEKIGTTLASAHGSVWEGNMGAVPRPLETAGVGDRRLLVIDDEPAFREFVRRIAEAEGFNVTVAADGDAFRRAYFEVKPTVIIVDLVMPDVEGIELLQYLAQQGCRARVLVISGYNPDYPRLAQAVAGSRGLKSVQALTKPIDAGKLRAALADPVT